MRTACRHLRWLVLVPALALGACGDDDDTADDGGDGDGGADGGTGVQPTLLTQEEALQVMSTANRLEVAQARLVLRHATNARVRAFARLLVEHHRAAELELETLVSDEAITPRVGDTSLGLQEDADEAMLRLAELVDDELILGEGEAPVEPIDDDAGDEAEDDPFGGTTTGATTEAIEELESDFIDFQQSFHQRLLTILDRQTSVPEAAGLRAFMQDARAQLLTHLAIACDIRADFDRAPGAVDTTDGLDLDGDPIADGDFTTFSCGEVLGLDDQEPIATD
jgi:predicted outer membrane protein